MRLLPIIVITTVLFGCASPKHQNPHVIIDTRPGEIEIELYPGQAPKSVAAFLSYIKRGYYKNASFYRVLNDDNQPSNAPKAELIQGGTYRSQPALNDTLPGIPHETTGQTKVLHTDGTLSLARMAPGTATTEFFICVGDQPGFNYGGENNPDGQGYAAFGKVIKGMNIVNRIYKMRERDQYFDPPVTIFNIEIVE